MSLTLNILAGTCTVLGFVPYIAAITRGQTRPNPASWFIWLVVGLVIFFSYSAAGGTAALGYAAGASFGQVIVCALIIKYGLGKLGTTEWICIAGALLSLLLWVVTSSPYLPHVLIVLMDCFAWLPTFRKTLLDPGSEDLPAWILWALGAVCTFFNITDWSFFNVLFPVYILTTNTLIALLLVRHFFIKKPRP